MRAVLCKEFGDHRNLVVDEVAPPPDPGPGQVKIAVSAAGLNFADLLMIGGSYQEKPALPFSPGLEAAGAVIAVGSGVARVKPGDRVMATVDHGAFAGQVLARESDVHRLPDDIDDVTAAGFAIAYGTAQGALRWRADVKPGETVLIHGAGGGVGLAAVEVAKAMGATVIATAGDAGKLAVAKEHGADHLIDYKTETLRTRIKEICAKLNGGGGVDVVYDPVGGEVFDQSLRCANWSGRLVVIGFASGTVPQIPANYLLVKNLSVLGLYWGSYRKHRPDLVAEGFAELFAWHRDGLLKPHVSETLDLAQAAAALDLIKTRRATGKVVLTTGTAS
jgi:NADPH2:quinone reductase